MYEEILILKFPREGKWECFTVAEPGFSVWVYDSLWEGELATYHIVNFSEIPYEFKKVLGPFSASGFANVLTYHISHDKN